MRVSMILGILLRETSREPAAILSALNEALLTQGEMGFTTACCLHLQPDGRYTAANAGHISPYLDGAECETLPSLPLGLAPDQEYGTSHGMLLPGQRLVLMSDGVPEARAANGELFGFERLPELTLRPGSEIAAIAQAYGQDDDITVLSLALVGLAPLVEAGDRHKIASLVQGNAPVAANG
jgi:serine phosphatase RsbU (regulator of sigma subunit)